MNGPTKEFRIEETYSLIQKLQPESLISAKSGYLGTEDYFAPEYHWLERNPDKTKEMIESGKLVEICNHIAGWGYAKKNDGKHRGAESVIENLKYAGKFNANLLLNTGPLPDGSIDKQDIETLKKVGQIIRKEGWSE